MPSRLSLPAILGLNLLLLGALGHLSGRLRAPAPDSGRSRNPALYLHWVRDLPALEPAWPDQPRFTSDAARQPVPAGNLLLLSCSRTDSLIALDATTGDVLFRFRCDGPVRFRPAVWKGRAYFVSDDGFLYCVDLAGGKLVWKFRGAPADRRILGNDRLISTWPARGAPIVAEDGDTRDTVYFAAGIWPFMGIFLYALDADTGAVRWQNSGDGSIFIKQPHQTDAFAGVAPQGSLVIDGDRLFVPGGRSLPACYDRHTGKLLHYRLADNSKRGGGPDVLAGCGVYINGGGGFEQSKGDYLGLVGEPAALGGSMVYSIKGTTCRAFDLTVRPPRPKPVKVKPKSKTKTKPKPPSEAWLGKVAGQASVPATTTLLATPQMLYGAGPGWVYALPLPLPAEPAASAWEARIEGTPIHLAHSGRRLFVSTREGRLYAFAPGEAKILRHRDEITPLPATAPAQVELARRVLETSNVREGYAVIWGGGTGGLASELLQRTALRLIVVEPDPRRADALRRRFQTAGIDGKRLCVLHATASTSHLPPYLCEMMAGENLDDFEVNSTFFSAVFSSLRPHGGIACLPLNERQREALALWASSEPAARIESTNGLTLISRPGSLPGAGNWTHEHADAANTRVSADRLVRAPLGLLWFGGPAHQGILPRHGHGPVPQVVDGRLIIEGPDRLRAQDVYTGRLLWEARLPGVGAVYDNLAHQPGANAAGSNYVSTSEGIFVAYRREGLRLDPATGVVVQRYQLPALRDAATPPEWSFLSVAGRYLVVGTSPAARASSKSKKNRTAFRGRESSRWLNVLDKESGKLLWQVEACQGWRHNALCAGNGRLFAIDRTTWNLPVLFSRRDKDQAEEELARLCAFDLATGKRLWHSEADVFGTWLSYSTEHDVLVEAGFNTRDTLSDEARGMRAYHGRDGRVQWDNATYLGPALIHGDRILKSAAAGAPSGSACELLTGRPIQVVDSLTGESREWKWMRTYGCNTPAACQNLLLFRSGAAGFFDLAGDSGTGNLGGFRSSCTMNLIAAGGVLTVPDYTRTCTCSYQQQTSVGLVHMPEAELWTFTTSSKPAGLIRRAGLNLGAPGSRRAEDGTLWVEYPAVGGASPRLNVTSKPARPDSFRWHTSQVQGGPLPWVAGSGLRGLRELTVRLGPDGSALRRYTVRLIFLEPDGLGAGRRLFDVQLQGETQLRRLDVSQQASGPGRGVVREFRGVLVRRDLVITLVPVVGEPVLSGVEIIQD
jgi:outer membrane protein assembly factor BamB